MSTCFFRFTLLLLAFVVLFAACGEDDNPIIDHDDDHDDEPFHADADGFVLKVDEEPIYRQFEGEHEGTIELKVGEELDVLALFLDHDGDEFLPENPEEEGEPDDHDHDHGKEEVFALALSEFDSSIIEIHLHEHEGEEHEDDHTEEDEHHDDELAEQFTFEVEGLKAGETAIKFQLLHGDHADFTAALMIPVTVTP